MYKSWYVPDIECSFTRSYVYTNIDSYANLQFPPPLQYWKCILSAQLCYVVHKSWFPFRSKEKNKPNLCD